LHNINWLDIAPPVGRGVAVDQHRDSPALGYLIKWVERGVRQELDAALKPLGISASEYTALSVLGDRRELSSAQLARRTFVSAQAMHPIVVGLEQTGLVSRRSDPDHGRVQLVSLTPRGVAALAACNDACAFVEKRLFGKLSRSELEALRRGLMKCANAMGRVRHARAA
jgi:DNA-binding MarR family transcriptional regulator